MFFSLKIASRHHVLRYHVITMNTVVFIRLSSRTLTKYERCSYTGYVAYFILPILAHGLQHFVV